MIELDYLEKLVEALSDERHVKSWHHEMSDPKFIRCRCTAGELRILLPKAIGRIRNLERELQNIEILTNGSSEVAGIHFLADNALKGNP